MRKKKDKKKIVDYFYRTKWEGGKEVKIPYEWLPGEKEEYIKTCESVSGWCGLPLDVNWAKGTNSYQEALKSSTCPTS